MWKYLGEVSRKGVRQHCMAGPNCTFWFKDLESEISTSGLDFKGLVPYPSPFFTFIICSYAALVSSRYQIKKKEELHFLAEGP